jgi:hypothetical protein
MSLLIYPYEMADSEFLSTRRGNSNQASEKFANKRLATQIKCEVATERFCE